MITGEKKKNIKLVFSDLDDTLIVNNKIPEFNREAILKLKEKGVKFILTTGRSYEMIQEILSQINLKDKANEYSICFNGGLICENENEKVLYFKELPFEKVEKIFKIGEKYDICIVVFTINKIYIYKPDPIEIERKVKLQKTNPIIMEQLDLTPLKSEKIAKILFAKYNEMEYLKKIKEEIEESFKEGELSLSFSSNRYIEINGSGINKGFAVKWLCNYLNIDIKDTMAIGDNYNDYTMIKEAGLGLVVNNAMDDVKQIANYICNKKFDEGGVKEALEKFILN